MRISCGQQRWLVRFLLLAAFGVTAIYAAQLNFEKRGVSVEQRGANPASAPFSAGLAPTNVSREPLQSGGSFNITPSIVAGGGGGGPSAGGNLTVTGSIGQSVLGVSSGGGLSIAGGFWGGGCPTITLISPDLPPARVGEFYSQTISAIGGSAPYSFNISAGALPPGLSLGGFTSNSVTISGVPTVAGTFSFTVKATDANGCMGMRPYVLVINPSICNGVVINLSPPYLPPGKVGAPYHQTLTAGGGIPPYTFSIILGALPPGLNLSANGVLSGTPTVENTFVFLVRATAANGCAGTQLYAVVVNRFDCPTLSLNPLALPGGTVGAPYQQTITASGGAPPYSFGVISGALPSGLSLSAGGVLAGTPTAAGTFVFIAQATDVNGCSGTQLYVVIINPTGCPAMALSPPSLPSGTVGTAYSQKLTATGAPPHTFSAIQGALPSGLNLSADGVLSGLPNAAGTFVFFLKATDANGCAGVQLYVLIINPAPCPTITLGPPSPLPSGAESVAYNQMLTASGAPAHTFSLNQGALPPGLSLSANGLLSGTPSASGTFVFIVKATDANGCAGTQLYVLIINPAGCATVALSPPTLPSTTVGSFYNQSLKASGATPHSFEVIAGALPTGLTLSASGALFGTPSLVGSFVFIVKATDTNGCAGAQLYVVIINPIPCPSITLSSLALSSGTVGTTYRQTLTASGGVASYTFSLLGGALPNGLTLASDGTLSGTPTLSGTFVFTIKAADANGCAGTQMYLVIINPAFCSGATIALSPPVLPSGTVGNAYNQTLTASGGVAPYSFNPVLGALPPGLNLTASGVLSGTPTDTGTFVFIVKATALNGCAGAQLYVLIINPVGCPATLAVSPATLPGGVAGMPYNQNITASGGAPPYGFSVLLGTLPPGLSLSVNGMLSGTPTAPGNFSFALKATDASSCMAASTVYTLQICPLIVISPAMLPDGQLGQPYSVQLSQTGGALPVIWSNPGGLPAGLSLNSASGLLSGTPTVSGDFNPTIRVTDVNGCLSERPYSLRINNCLSGTITLSPATLANGFVGTPYNQSLIATGGVAPYSFAVTAGALPNGLNLASNGGLTGTPTVQAIFNFTVTATDSNGCTGMRPYSVIISGNGLMFYPLAAPVRLLDTRPGASPNACSQPNAPIIGQNARTQLGRNFCTIPANAQALTGNITTVQSGGGFLTLYPSGAGRPIVASTNFNANEVINNVFTVGLGATDGAFNIYAHTTTDVVVDVTGYYAPPATGGLFFHPLPAPVRLLETRPGQPVGCVKPGVPLVGMTDTIQQAISACTGIPAAARAIVGNATTVDPQGLGFLTLFPGDAARPLVASSNYNFGQIVNGPFSVRLAAKGEFKIYTHWTTHLVVDVLGYYSTEANDANGAGLLLTPLAHPVRLLETRPGLPVGCFKPGVPLLGGAEATQTARGLCDGLTIPANALGVVGNATVVFPFSQGFLTLWPSTALRPLVATSNYNAGDVGNRHFIVGLGQADGAFKIYTHATSHLVIDLSGYFAP